jgi:hypothetical protein
MATAPAHEAVQAGSTLPSLSQASHPSGIGASIAAATIVALICAACTPCTANPTTRARASSNVLRRRAELGTMGLEITGVGRARKGSVTECPPRRRRPRTSAKRRELGEVGGRTPGEGQPWPDFCPRASQRSAISTRTWPNAGSALS